MNTAQKNLTLLLNKIPATETKEIEFIKKNIEIWEGYNDKDMSFPYWQEINLEKEYGTSVPLLKNKYNKNNPFNCSFCGLPLTGSKSEKCMCD